MHSKTIHSLSFSGAGFGHRIAQFPVLLSLYTLTVEIFKQLHHLTKALLFSPKVDLKKDHIFLHLIQFDMTFRKNN
jgi:ribosomal protein L25 (general stress protein Ctc)